MARDPYRNERLPDLPNVGFATASEKEISDLIQFFMREVERQRPLLLEIVIAGRDKWVETARRIWGVRRLLTEDKVGEIYDYFAQQAGPNPRDQLAALAALRS